MCACVRVSRTAALRFYYATLSVLQSCSVEASNPLHTSLDQFRLLLTEQPTDEDRAQWQDGVCTVKERLGVMLADYFSVRRMRLQLAELYRVDGAYGFGGSGINSAAIVALLLGVASALVGLLVPRVSFLYDMSWFIGFGISYAAYVVLMPRSREVQPVS